MIAKGKTNTYRTTATVVGIGLFQSILGGPDHLSTVAASSMLLGIGAILWLMAVIGDGARGS